VVCETNQRGSNIDFIEYFQVIRGFSDLSNRSILVGYKRIHSNIRICCKFGCNANLNDSEIIPVIGRLRTGTKPRSTKNPGSQSSENLTSAFGSIKHSRNPSKMGPSDHKSLVCSGSGTVFGLHRPARDSCFNCQARQTLTNSFEFQTFEIHKTRRWAGNRRAAFTPYLCGNRTRGLACKDN
jgi:hypothetical protein